MDNKVLHFIDKHHLIKKDTRILIGVSGGPDSMALLHYFHRLKDAWNLQVHVVTVDHQLRKEDSKQDVLYVKKMCNKWNIQFDAIAVDVHTYKQQHNVSTQVAARKLRYEVFHEQMQNLRADYLALGHHGDDQIETIIMSLARTTNLSSITGIPLKRQFSSGEIIRPFLCVTKKEIEEYCESHMIQPRLDTSNLDTKYTRNDIRKHVVPFLKKRNTNLHTTMQLLSESLYEDEQYLHKETKKLFKQAIQMDQKNKKANIDISLFTTYPLPLQRRAYRLTLDYLYDILPRYLTHTHERIFFSLLKEEENNKTVDFPHQLMIEKSYNHIHLYFAKDKQEKEPIHKIINKIPTCIVLPNGAILSISYQDESVLDEDKYTYICSANELELPLHIRTRRPGDRMRYQGLQGSKKIKDILIDEKVPRNERDNLYILTDNQEQILWLIGVRKGELLKMSNKKPFILFEYKEDLSKGEKDA